MRTEDLSAGPRRSKNPPGRAFPDVLIQAGRIRRAGIEMSDSRLPSASDSCLPSEPRRIRFALYAQRSGKSAGNGKRHVCPRFQPSCFDERLQVAKQTGLMEDDYVVETSRRIVPMTRSTWARCRRDRAADRTSSIPWLSHPCETHPPKTPRGPVGGTV